MNRTILGMLRATAYDNPGDWPDKLPAIMAAYRMTPHITTGVTPNYAMLAREVRLSCSLIATPPEETQNLIPYNVHFRDNVRAAHERVRNATNRSSKTQKSYFDARVKAISLTKGQLVWLYWPKPLLRQQKRKLTQLWFGPYRITNFKSEVVVEVQHIKTNKTQVVHVDRLVPCTTVPEITSPRTSPSNTFVSSTPPLVDHSAPHSREHQSPTTTQTPLNQPVLRRSTRPVRRPARYDD